MFHIFATLYCFLHLKSRHEDMKLFSHSVIGFRGQDPDFARVFGLLALSFLIQKFQQIWPLRIYCFLLASEFDFSVCTLGLSSTAEILRLSSGARANVTFYCQCSSKLGQFPYLGWNIWILLLSGSILDGHACLALFITHSWVLSDSFCKMFLPATSNHALKENNPCVSEVLLSYRSAYTHNI